MLGKKCSNEVFPPKTWQVSRSSPVTPGAETHHILFFQCQPDRTIATHLCPVFFFRVDSYWMMDGAVSSCFPLMFGFWIIPELSVVVLGGFCSNLVCFCHTAMKDSLLVLACLWGWLISTGAGVRGRLSTTGPRALQLYLHLHIIFMGSIRMCRIHHFCIKNK